MLFDSSLRKELSRSFFAVTIVLVTVVITVMLIRTLGQASKGSISPSDIMLVLGYTVLGYMPIVLTLALFVAIIATLARMYRDSEMVIWFASGRGLAGFLPVLVRFSWPVVLGVALTSLLGWPWSQAQILELRHQFQQRSDLDRVAPGEFQVSAGGDSVFFVDRGSNSLKDARQIFFAQQKPGESSVTTARQASVIQKGGQTWVVLGDGQRVEELHGAKQGIRVADFSQYEVLLHSEPLTTPELTLRSMGTAQLLAMGNYPGSAAELTWRFGQVLAAINYVILALALTSSSPRSGRSGHIITALLIFVVYFNLLSLAQNWVGLGRIHMGPMLLLLHGGVFLAAVLWLAARNADWTLRRFLARRKVAA